MRRVCTRLPDMRMCTVIEKYYFFLNQNIHCGYSKEPSHTFKLMERKIISILRSLVLLNWVYVYFFFS